mmetsp:Transcript_56907/g.160617  ORF Transcript_56907/g.160617 Transcript_56907/m.160617 type:complete len:164 (-) Transcript_56907:1073-1564(-)
MFRMPLGVWLRQRDSKTLTFSATHPGRGFSASFLCVGELGARPWRVGVRSPVECALPNQPGEAARWPLVDEECPADAEGAKYGVCAVRCGSAGRQWSLAPWDPQFGGGLDEAAEDASGAGGSPARPIVRRLAAGAGTSATMLSSCAARPSDVPAAVSVEMDAR